MRNHIENIYQRKWSKTRFIIMYLHMNILNQFSNLSTHLSLSYYRHHKLHPMSIFHLHSLHNCTLSIIFHLYQCTIDTLHHLDWNSFSCNHNFSYWELYFGFYHKLGTILNHLRMLDKFNRKHHKMNHLKKIRLNKYINYFLM